MVMVMVTCKADTQCCATGRRHKPGKVLRDNSGRSRASASAQGTRHRPDIFFRVIFIAFDCRHQFLFSAGPNYYWLLHKEQLSFLHISQKIQMFNISTIAMCFATWAIHLDAATFSLQTPNATDSVTTLTQDHCIWDQLKQPNSTHSAHPNSHKLMLSLSFVI